MNNSKLVKIMHIILFVITALYLLESIFLRGLFTNPLIALVNIIVAIIAMVIAFIKKEKEISYYWFIYFNSSFSNTYIFNEFIK